MALALALPVPAGAGAPALDGGLSAPMRLLCEAVDGLRAQVAPELPGPQALVEVALLMRELAMLRAVALARLADVDRRGLHDLEGAPSTATWVARQQSGMERSDVALARRLDRLPLVADEVASGLLSVACAQRIGTVLDRLRPYVDRPDGLIDGQSAEPVLTAVVVDGVSLLVAEGRGGYDEDDAALLDLRTRLAAIASAPEAGIARLEAAFLVLAQHLEPGLLAGALARLADAIVPDRLAERADRAHRDRGFGLRLNHDGSGWTITDRDLDLECGELLHTFLQAEMATDPDNPADTAAFRDDGCGSAGRSLRQRRHDALTLGLRRYLDSGIAGMRDKVAPHLAVTVSAAALHGAPGALPARGASGASLPIGLVRHWLCDSAITRFVLSLGNKVLEASHTARTLKAHERRAKHLETGGVCQGAGCTRGPGHRLVPHHPVAYAVDPITSLADTVLLCERTHQDIHEGGRTILLKDGRYLGPDGWATGPSG